MANTKKFSKTRKNSLKKTNKNKTKNNKSRKLTTFLQKRKNGSKKNNIKGGAGEPAQDENINKIIANYILCKGYYTSNKFQNSMKNDNTLMNYLTNIGNKKAIFKYLIQPIIHNSSEIYSNSVKIENIQNSITNNNIVSQFTNFAPPPRPTGPKPQFN